MSTREIAEQIVARLDWTNLNSLAPRELADAIDAALTKAIAEERERAIRIFESHTQSMECEHENSCVVETIAAIRRDSTGEEGS
jgi:hypothetical protein